MLRFLYQVEINALKDKRIVGRVSVCRSFWLICRVRISTCQYLGKCKNNGPRQFLCQLRAELLISQDQTGKV